MTLEEMQQVLHRESDAVLNIPVGENFNDAINLICKKVHDEKGKLVTSGMGKAGQIALNIATTFSSTGTPAVFLHPSEAQHGDLGVLQAHDVMLLISNSGKTREILELVTLTHNLYPQTPFIIITSNPESPLAEIADVLLLTGNPDEVCALGLCPTTSTTVMTVIGDVLVVGAMSKIGFTRADYNKRHHGGYLGQKSKQ